jgi:hypothetical protein
MTSEAASIAAFNSLASPSLKTRPCSRRNISERVAPFRGNSMFFAPPFLPSRFQMAKFIQLLRHREPKSSNMLPLCYLSCYRLSR